MSIEQRVSEVGFWQSQAGKLQRRRDRLVSLSIPGWVSMAVILPKFISAAINSDQAVAPWLRIAAPLSVLAGWGIFHVAEDTEKARLVLLAKLDRAGEDISEMINAGKFPWVRHFVDNESWAAKVTRFFDKM